MQQSINKSQQLNYSNCKLSPIIFYPDTIQRDKKNLFNLDNRNRLTFLQSSKMSGIIGIIEPDLSTVYYNKLKDLATPLGKESNQFSIKSAKQNSKNGEGSSLKKFMPTFNYPWNTRNITFDSNKNFKLGTNPMARTNRDSAFKNLILADRTENNSKIECFEGKPQGEITRPNFQANPTAFQNNLSNVKPQVYSSILKIKKVENVIYDDVPVTNYHNEKNKINYCRKEKNVGNNVNLTIINNNNFNVKNITKIEKRRGRKSKKTNQTDEMKISSDDFENDEWMPNNFNDHLGRVKVKSIQNKTKNWKKVIEICNGKLFINKFRSQSIYE
jgi:hypothetical protein